MSSFDASPDRFFRRLLFATGIPIVLFTLSDIALPDSFIADQATVWMMFLGSSAHVASSFFFYSDPEMRAHMLGANRGRFVWAPIFVIAAMAAVFASMPAALPYVSMFYWICQTHHYTRQNHSILAFTSKAYGGAPSELERTALTLSGVGGVIGALTVLAPYRDTFLAEYGWHVHAVALGAYAGGWLLFVVSLAQNRERPAHRMRALMPVVLMLFYLPLFVFHDVRLAVGSYAMAHGLQYLVFMSYVAASPAKVMRRRAATLIAFIVVLGGGLELLQKPHLMGEYKMPIFGAYLGIVMWHFLLAGGVWRLREPFQRSYMAERFPFLKS